MTKRNFIKTTKTIQTLYIIALLDDASNKNNNNVLIMKSITTKRNSIFWVSNKKNHTYPTMATLTSMNLKMVFIVRHFLID
jgi:hypothetical protein